MKSFQAVRALLKDRRRAQRGSVLSAVLILVALLSILCGALATELSTSFLLSRNLMNRAANQATVNSAVELSLGQLQSTQLNAPCPSLGPTVALNGRTAVPAYSTCWPTIDAAAPTRFTQLAGASRPFSLDGTHTLVGRLNDYVVANPDGTIFDYTFGSALYRWRLFLPNSTVTGTPLVMADPQNNGQYIDVIPLSGSFCAPSADCLEVRSDDLSGTPSHQCKLATSAPVTQLAGSSSGIAYYGDGTSLGMVDLSGGDCDPGNGPIQIPGTQPVVKGLIAFTCTRSNCGRSTDMVYAVVADGGSSRVVQFSNNRNGFGVGPFPAVGLPWGNPIGLDISGSSVPSLPASVAITFQGGGIALVQIALNGSPTLVYQSSIPAGIGDAPYWCTQCGNFIGVGGQNGQLYVFDSVLSLIATYTGPSARINTTPQADGAGNWYFGADDGFVYEVQVQPGQPLMTFADKYGPMAQVGSSVQVGGCSTGICVYLGGFNRTTYLIPLDARAAVLSACISTSPPQCTGENPRLWASVQVGVQGNPKAVRVLGWSYYSP